MTGPEVLDVARDAVLTLVLVASPLMLIGLVVGVAISLFQALTQIQEMTLVFVPKILAIFIATYILHDHLVFPFTRSRQMSHLPMRQEIRKASVGSMSFRMRSSTLNTLMPSSTGTSYSARPSP